jgi:L-cysteine desulfidase
LFITFSSSNLQQDEHMLIKENLNALLILPYPSFCYIIPTVCMRPLRQINDLLCAEILAVTGCTEPASVAFAFRRACLLLRQPLDPMTVRARLDASSDVLRNASTAMVPFLNCRGLRVVVAVGLSSTANTFNVFPAIEPRTARILLKRRSWLAANPVRRKGIYIKATLFTPNESVAVVIQGRHDEIRSVARNGKIVYRGATRRPPAMTMAEILAVAAKRDPGMENAARQFITRQVRGDLSVVMPERIAALVRARMRGSSAPVMTITGSGNQGIFLSVPYCELYQKHGNRILPAVVVSLLTQILLTEKRKRISDKCGLATKAAPALAAGLAFAEGRDPADIRRLMSEVEQRMRDMRCYGARASCGNKAARAFRQVLKSVADSRLANRKDTLHCRHAKICPAYCRGFAG